MVELSEGVPLFAGSLVEGLMSAHHEERLKLAPVEPVFAGGYDSSVPNDVLSGALLPTLSPVILRNADKVTSLWSLLSPINVDDDDKIIKSPSFDDSLLLRSLAKTPSRRIRNSLLVKRGLAQVVHVNTLEIAESQDNIDNSSKTYTLGDDLV